MGEVLTQREVPTVTFFNIMFSQVGSNTWSSESHAAGSPGLCITAAVYGFTVDLVIFRNFGILG